MNGYLYCGDFIVYTQGLVGSRRFFTLRPNNEILLDEDRNAASVLRLYMGGGGRCVFTTRPMTKDGVENAYDVVLRFDKDCGAGVLETSPCFYQELIVRSSIGPKGGTDYVKIKDYRLGSMAGRRKPEDHFYLEFDMFSLFPPGPWTFEPVELPPFSKRDKRLLNFADDTIAIEIKESDVRSSHFERARLIGCDFTGSKLDEGWFNDTVFGENGKIAILNDTTWAKGYFNNTNFSGCSLERADFRDALFNLPDPFPFPDPRVTPTQFKGANLKGADFTGCDLRGLNFENADLTGAKLAGAKMHTANLTNATLTGADLSRTDLTTVVYGVQRPIMQRKDPSAADRKTNLCGVTLKADLLGKDWRCLDLTGATLQDIPTDMSNLLGCYSIMPKVNFAACNLTDADLRFATLNEAKFNSANLHGAMLSGLDLTTAEFDKADFSGTNLVGTDLSGRDLTTVINSLPAVGSADTANRTKLCRTKFNAGLFGKNWTALDMTDAVIEKRTETDLTGMQANDALLSSVTLSGANFNPAKKDGGAVNSSFARVRFNGADLTRVQFKNASLEGAQFGSFTAVFRMPYPDGAADWKEALAGLGFEPAATATLMEVESARHSLLRTGRLGDEKTFVVRREMRAGGLEELVVLEEAVAATLSKAYLAGASLKNANLEGATADSVHIYSLDGSTSQLEGAMMSRIRLIGANLGSASLAKVQMQGATLTGAILTNADLREANLSAAADGSSTDLTASHLSGANFKDAKLHGALLTDAAIATANGVYLFSVETQLKSELEVYKTKQLNKAAPDDFDEILAAMTSLDTTKIIPVLKASLFDIGSAATATLLLSETCEWDVEDKKNKKTWTVKLNTTGTSPVLQTADKTFPSDFLPNYLMALRTKRIDILIPAFRQLDIDLSHETSVTEKQSRSARWRVRSDGHPDIIVWTRLFDIGQRKLIAETAWEQIRSAFNTKSRPLELKATLKKLSGTEAWLVDNDSDNPGAFTQGYVKFKILAAGDITVYGTDFRVSRLAQDDRLEVVTQKLSPPGYFDRLIMDGETTLPNGSKLKDLGTATWKDEWLHAADSPQPPKCVPSRDGYCPPD